MGLLDNRHAVVTGGGSGIGLSSARALAAAGARVTLMGRNQGNLETAVKSLPAGRGHAVVCDISGSATVREAFALAEKAAGPVDILVSNAGLAHSAPFLKQDLAGLQEMLAVNSVGPWLCAQAALPGMLDRGWGRIVTVASTAGLKGYAYVSGYVMSKHAAVGLTRALALEVAGKGVTVNAVCPGYTETDIVRQAVANIMAKTGRTAAEARQQLARQNPSGRLVQPDEVAATLLWLCGPDSASVNGQAIAVDGGETAG